VTDLKQIDAREVAAYTVGEAAHYLGVPKSTLRSWFAGQRGFRAVIKPADAKALGLSFTNLVEAYVLTAIRR
jgi:DNA-binding transcriptional regulator YiaG